MSEHVASTEIGDVPPTQEMSLTEEQRVLLEACVLERMASTPEIGRERAQSECLRTVAQMGMIQGAGDTRVEDEPGLIQRPSDEELMNNVSYLRCLKSAMQTGLNAYEAADECKRLMRMDTKQPDQEFDFPKDYDTFMKDCQKGGFGKQTCETLWKKWADELAVRMSSDSKQRDVDITLQKCVEIQMANGMTEEDAYRECEFITGRTRDSQLKKPYVGQKQRDSSWVKVT